MFDLESLNPIELIEYAKATWGAGATGLIVGFVIGFLLGRRK